MRDAHQASRPRARVPIVPPRHDAAHDGVGVTGGALEQPLAAGGQVAAFATVWYDDVAISTGYIGTIK